MKLEKLLQEMQKEYELKEPIPQVSPGVWQIPVEEGIYVTLTQLPQGMHLFSSFMDAPIGEEEKLYEHMLYANLFGQGTQGAVLGLNEEGRKLTLSHLIDYDIDYKAFQDLFEDFVNSIDFWLEEALTYSE